jgi:hypothetical protein
MPIRNFRFTIAYFLVAKQYIQKIVKQ